MYSCNFALLIKVDDLYVDITQIDDLPATQVDTFDDEVKEETPKNAFKLSIFGDSEVIDHLDESI